MIGDAGGVESGAVLAADLCVVGAGAAGITIALQFVRSGLRVLLLEAGGKTEEPATQALYAGEAGALHPPLATYRRRAFGGSTAIWGGRCVPLDPIDFEPRAWMPHSGWPIGLDALMPYYPDANALCEAGKFAYTADDAFPRGMRAMLPDFAGENFSDDTLERSSCPTDFARRYCARLAASADVSVLLHANVTELICNEAGDRIARVRVRTLSGREFFVQAGVVVLAAGGLEVARLLLASRARNPAGVGNAHDLVGRFYMCHIAGTAGDITLSQDAWHGYERADDGTYCRRRLALRDEAQRTLGAGNFIARLHHPRIADPAHRSGALSALYFAKPFIAYEYAKRLHGEDRASWFAHARNIALDPAGTAGFLLHWLRDRSLAERKFPSVIVRSRANRYSIDFHAEQAPNPESRVMLSDTRDALGMRQLRVDWRYSPIDIYTVRAAFAVLAQDLRASGAGELRYDDAELEHACLRDGAYGGHHLGTARMARDSREGVVDADCRVHGMANLYVAGSAVFPTSGQANPTLTIVALALRLAKEGIPPALNRDSYASNLVVNSLASDDIS